MIKKKKKMENEKENAIQKKNLHCNLNECSFGCNFTKNKITKKNCI